MNDNREQLTQQIIDAGRFLYGRGWSPATSSNYSARLDEQRARCSTSRASTRASWASTTCWPPTWPATAWNRARTLGGDCTQLYAWNPAIGAVLHTHR